MEIIGNLAPFCPSLLPFFRCLSHQNDKNLLNKIYNLDYQKIFITFAGTFRR